MEFGNRATAAGTLMILPEGAVAIGMLFGPGGELFYVLRQGGVCFPFRDGSELRMPAPSADLLDLIEFRRELLGKPIPDTCVKLVQG